MSEYLVIYEQAEDGGWDAYLPDLPGVVALGETREQTATRIREAVAIYAEEMAELAGKLPTPATAAETIQTA
jgi:predicted RNase H-like HicB family nuclease